MSPSRKTTFVCFFYCNFKLVLVPLRKGRKLEFLQKPFSNKWQKLNYRFWAENFDASSSSYVQFLPVHIGRINQFFVWSIYYSHCSEPTGWKTGNSNLFSNFLLVCIWPKNSWEQETRKNILSIFIHQKDICTFKIILSKH